MYRTIMLSNRSFIQGRFIRTTEDGRIVVRVGHQVFAGLPVSSAA